MLGGSARILAWVAGAVTMLASACGTVTSADQVATSPPESSGISTASTETTTGGALAAAGIPFSSTTEGLEDAGASADATAPSAPIAARAAFTDQPNGVVHDPASGSIWVTTVGGTLHRLSAQTLVEEARWEFEGGLRGMAVSPDHVWVALEEVNEVVGVDLASNQIVCRIETEATPFALVLDAEAVLWVTNRDAARVTRVDLTNVRATPPGSPCLAPQLTVRVGKLPWDLAVLDGVVWVTGNGDDTLGGFDASTGEQVRDAILIGTEPRELMIDRSTPGSLLVGVYGESRVKRVDTSSGLVQMDLTVGHEPIGIESDATHIFIVAREPSLLEVFDASSAARVGEYALPSTPEFIASDDDHLWITIFSTREVIRVDKRDLTTANP